MCNNCLCSAFVPPYSMYSSMDDELSMEIEKENLRSAVKQESTLPAETPVTSSGTGKLNYHCMLYILINDYVQNTHILFY